MLVQIFVALAKHGDEVIVLGTGTNARLVEIQRDSFIWREDHRDWKVQTQTHELKVTWKEEEDVSKATPIPDERKNLHAEVLSETESKITKENMVV